MPFYAELTVDEKTFVVHDFYFSVIRSTNLKLQPDSPPSWTLDVTIDAVNETTLTKWMIDPSKKLDGKLTIFKTVQEGAMKKYEFKQSSCFGMIDRFIPSLAEASCYLRIRGSDMSIDSTPITSNQ